MTAETLSIVQAITAPSTLEHSWVSFYKPFLVENTEVFFACCAAYLLALYAIPRYMSDKKAAEPKTFAFFWNVALASFSAAGVYHLSVPVAGELLDRGFDSWLCQGGPHTSWETAKGAMPFYMFVFICSKIPELVDTVLLLVKKREVMTLHWYHHSTVLLYSLHGGIFSTATGTGPMFGAMNFFVHSVMYTYYALATLGFRFKQAWIITILQIAQMFAGMYISFAVGRCSGHDQRDRTLALVMYASYAWLFIEFFFRRFSPFGGKKTKRGAKGQALSSGSAGAKSETENGGKTEESDFESKKYD